MKKRTGLKLLVNACPRCGGSAYLEDPDLDEWRCLQCARSVPAPAAARNTSTAA
jgi:ribosomal protein S27AE